MRTAHVLMGCILLLNSTAVFAADGEETSGMPQSLNETPLFVDDKMNLERRQSKEIAVEGMKSFLVVNPEIAHAALMPDMKGIVIQGSAFGRTLCIYGRKADAGQCRST